MRPVILATCAVVLIAVGAPRARAAPTVAVKARTAIEIDPIRRGSDGIVVRGRLVDKLTRAPIGWADLEVFLDNRSERVVTEPTGQFEAWFAVTGGRHDLVVEFHGDLHRDPSRYEIAGFDVTKNPLDIDLTLSRSVASYGVDEIGVVVTSTSDFGGAALSIELLLGEDGAVDDELELIDRIRTDESGRGEVTLAPDRLGPPGRKLMVARYRGDDAYDAARAQQSFAVKTDTAITFALSSGDVKFEDEVRGTGRVSDARGGPIEGGAVSLVEGSRHLAETATDEDGAFSFELDASEIGDGKYKLQAVFEPARDYQRGSRSELVALTVAQPEPVPVSYTIAAFVATALALLAFIAMRTRPWEAWLARLRTRRADDQPDAGDDGGGDTVEVQTGLSLARPSLVSTLRRTKDHGFSGMVRNAVTHRPVGGARVILRAGDEERLLDVDGAGRFAADMLPTGTWQVEVAGFGYVTEQFTISVPHRGELRGARVDLLPVRERIFAMYGEAARPLLPDAGLWGIWTPRQIFDHVRESRPPASALSDLTDFVEETYFSQRTPGEELIGEARERIQRARADVG
jgi:hypothetical protein